LMKDEPDQVSVYDAHLAQSSLAKRLVKENTPQADKEAIAAALRHLLPTVRDVANIPNEGNVMEKHLATIAGIVKKNKDPHVRDLYLKLEKCVASLLSAGKLAQEILRRED